MGNKDEFYSAVSVRGGKDGETGGRGGGGEGGAQRSDQWQHREERDA